MSSYWMKTADVYPDSGYDDTFFMAFDPGGAFLALPHGSLGMRSGSEASGRRAHAGLCHVWAMSPDLVTRSRIVRKTGSTYPHEALRAIAVPT